jgi:hypothetical protein
MADPVTIGTLAAAALSAAAGALGKELANTAVKEAYAALKAAVAKWAAPNVEQLEAKPDSEARAEVLAEIVNEQADDAKAEIKTLAEALQAELHKAGYGATVANRVTVIADRGSIAAGGNVNLGDLKFGTFVEPSAVSWPTTTTTWPGKK